MGDSNINPADDTVLAAQEQELDDAIKGMSNEELYCAFALSLLDEKGFADLEPLEQQKMVTELVPRIEAFVTQELYFALPDEQSSKLDQMVDLDGASAEQVQQLYQEAGVDMGEVISKALDDFRDLYLGDDKPQDDDNATLDGGEA